MYGFMTQSGSSYTVANGRVSRLGDNDVVGRPGAIVNRSAVVSGFPVKGQPFRFRLKGDSGDIVTSPVTMVVSGAALDAFAAAR